MNNNELYHYGVLGMKWGVRKSINSGVSNSKKKFSRDQEDNRIKGSRKKDVKNRRKLSDEDLKKKIERLKMEKQLKELTAEEISPGKKFVSDVMSSSGKKVAGTLVTGATLYAVKVAMTKQFNIKEMASYMTPKPKNK